MRNLKRALSLALASVMVLGLMVVGSGASYADVTSEENVEAIEVLQAVGAMVGDDNGNFNPDRNVTRAQMAAVMSNLLDLKVEDFNAADIPFTDVPSWAVPYVAACYADGITAGVSDTLYGSDNTVTAAQAALMMMKALGYFQYSGDFEQDWTLATIKKGSEIGIFDGITVDRTSPLTRNDVAQMALNALKSNMVLFTGEVGMEIPTAGGGTINVGYKAEYTARTSANSQYNQISAGTTDIASNNQYYVQLGEELYNGDLQLSDSIDDFGRPSRHWEYDGEEIGDYAKEELIRASYTVKVEGGDIYGDIGASACKYDLTYWIDGEEKSSSYTDAQADKLTRRNTEQVGTTAKGVLTEVYVDTQAEETTIVEIHTYLAKAITDYNDRSERLTIEVYTGRDSSGNVLSTSKRLELEDLPTISKYVEDDFMMVTMADGVVKTVADPEVVADAYVSAYSSKPDDGDDHSGTDGRLTSVTADGTKYDISAEAYYDPAYLYDYSDDSQQLDGHTYDLMLDPYGYLLGIENVTDDENFFFVVGYEVGSSVLAKTVDKALVIFPDGTMKTVDAMEKDGAPDVTTADESNVNAWYNYTVNSDGVYVISGLTNRQFAETRTSSDPDEGKINSSNTTMGTDIDVAGTSVPNWVYGNNDSVYISVDKDTSVIDTWGSIVDVNGVSTGIKNTSIVPGATVGQFGQANKANVFGLYNSNGYVTYAVVVGDNGSVSENFVYLTSGITGSYYDSETKQYIYEYDAITNDSDEIVTVESTTRTAVGGAQLKADSLYVASYDADGFIDKMELKTDDNTGSGAKYNTETYKDEGYGQMTIASGDSQQVVLSGAVLYLDASDNDEYVVLDEDARFFVNGQDDDNGEYDLYPTAASALAALGESNIVTGAGKIVIIADSTTGFGTTVIFLDAKYEETGSPATPTTGEIKLSGVSIGGTSIGSPNGYEDIDDAVQHARTISLSDAQLDQKLSLTASSTTAGVTNIRATIKVFNTADDVYSFIGSASDTNTFANAGTSVSGTTASGLALGNGNVIVIEIHDNINSADPTYFAYVVNARA